MAEAWDFPSPNGDGFGFWLENLSVSGGVALNGEEQNVFGENMRWRARGGFTFRTKDQILRGRALFDKLQGRAGTILVPAFDGKRANWPIDAWGRTLHPGFTRRKRLEGTIYEDPAIPLASQITASVAVAALARATTLQILLGQGSPILAGQFFGFDNHLYRVKTVTGPVADVYTVTFLPPLRAATDAGNGVRFDNPVCEMRQASDDQGLKELLSMRFASVTLEFIEAF